MDFWNEYFEMRKQKPITSSSAAILRLTCLEIADRRWNPNYMRDHERAQFNPLHPVSKRKLRYLRMYWALRKKGV